MNLKSLKYLSILTILIFVYLSFTMHGVWTFAVAIYAYILVPGLEFILPGKGTNMTNDEEIEALKDKTYDIMLYAMVPILFGVLVFFLFSIREPGLSTFEIIGRISSMGLVAVTLGFNVGHELGHRNTRHEKIMSRAMLLVSLQMHFVIEHNYGHHKRVATEEDPASARYGEVLYTFWFRSWIMGYISAWKLEAKRLKNEGLPFYSIHNEMIRFEIIQILFVAAIFVLFGGFATLAYLVAAFISKILFETINYIEHYGLTRKRKNKSFEKVLPVHSWNSNKDVGRVLLFELTRHSDHHYKASRKYQILKHYEDVPQMPAGYPAMILLSFIPPLWFYVMHRKIDRFKKENPAGAALA